MYTQKLPPKFLLKFYKGQKVPPLVTKYDFQSNAISLESKESHPSSIEYPFQYQNSYPYGDRQSQGQNHDQSQNFSQVNSLNKNHTVRKEDAVYQFQKEIQENRELRLIIKELQEKIERLTDINSELMERVQDLEKKSSTIIQINDTSKRQLIKRTKVQVYREIQIYLKILSQKFTQSLVSLRMSPVVQQKIEEFLEQLLSINSISVSKTINDNNFTRQRKLFDENEANRTIKQIIERHSKSKSKSQQKSISVQKQKYLQLTKYDAVLEKLSENQQLSYSRNKQNQKQRQRSRMNSQNPSPYQSKWRSDNKDRGRRPRIFRNRQGNQEGSFGHQSNSRSHIRNVEF